MVQQRIYDFGALLTQARTKSLAAKLFTPGIYEGLDPTVVSSPFLQLSAGALLLPNGVLIVEDAPVDTTAPLAVGDYTLTADHDDIQAVGGSPILYTWRSGILDRSGDPNSNSLAVLWLRSTGGPITPGMLSVPPDVKTGNALPAVELLSGFVQAPFHLAGNVAQGPNITATAQAHTSGAQHMGVLVFNSAPSGVQTYQFRVPLPALPWARYVDIYADMPNNSSIGFATGIYGMVAQDGSAVTVTPSLVSGLLSGLTTPAATVALASTATQPVTMGITVTVPALSSGVFLKGFRLRGD